MGANVLMAMDAVSVHLDHNLGFDIEADASNCQLGAIVKQNGHPVVHCSQKLSATQKNCTTIEKELLSVAEMLHTFCSMLLGTKIVVHTDHKNPTHKLPQFTAQCVMHWNLLSEECAPTFVCENGSKSCIDDALSQVTTKDKM